MKKIFSIIAVLGLLFVSSCEEEIQVCDECNGFMNKEVTIFVDGILPDCDDGMDVCFYAQETDSLDEDVWEVWNTDICGFEFEPAYRYRLTVKKDKIDTVNGEKIYKYCLIRIEEKVKIYL